MLSSRFERDTASLSARINLKANIASPALTGTPTSTTANVIDNSTQVATTAFVRSRINIDTSYLFQKTDLGLITLSITNTLSSAKTFIDKNDTANMLQDRYNSDVVPVKNRVTAIENSRIILGTTSMALGGTYTSVTGLSSVNSTNFTGTLSGTASTADKLTTSKNINGVAFDGTTDITVTADANTLTGNTLKSTVTASSLTSVGTITSGTWSGVTIAVAKGGTGLTSTPINGQIDIGNGTGFTRTTITPGSGIAITNESGSITVATSGITSANLSSTAGITNAQLAGSITASKLVGTDITTVGTITSGTWSGSTIAVAKGGTGSTTLSGVLLGNGTNAISTAAEGTNYSLVREMNEEFTVDASQASISYSSSGADGVVSALFTLTQIPNTKSFVKIYINGVRISNNAFRFNTNSIPGTANGSPSLYIGYIPFKNGTYKLTTGDRIQIDYYY